MIKRIAITGPESTGKSNLAKSLALHYHAHLVPEFAREYLDKINREYQERDLLSIAKGQFETEEKISKQANEYLFIDTDFLVMKIWSLHKYGKCDPWIINKFENHQYDLYLLCDVDIPWQPDPQREHPDIRQYLFDWYLKELSSANLNYKIVSGTGETRVDNAIKFINNTFK
jgi:NadR type nicotinamide-nucleotide adenylyltransferase